MDKSSNWEIFYSISLKMYVAFNKSENTLYVKDLDVENEKESDIKTDKTGLKYIPVIYSESELAALEGRQISLRLHQLKKIFKGTIEIYKEETNVK